MTGINSTAYTYLDLYQMHDQLVHPVTYLNAALELWEYGMQEPGDIGRMRSEIERLVVIVRDLQTRLREQPTILAEVA